MRKVSALGLTFLLAAAASYPQTASETQLRKDVDALNAQVKALRAELDQIKAQLPAARPNPVIDIGSAQSSGSPQAKIALIEFSDYQCPFCGEYFNRIYRSVIDEYVKTGKVRYIVRDFPSEKIHPMALKSAEAARCAAEQGKFWEMHDQLFTNQKTLADTGITDSAKAAGLNMDAFQTCFDSEKYVAAIKKDVDETNRLGVQGTPAFFFGTPDPVNPSKIRLSNGLVGAQPIENFRKVLDGLLAK